MIRLKKTEMEARRIRLLSLIDEDGTMSFLEREMNLTSCRIVDIMARIKRRGIIINKIGNKYVLELGLIDSIVMLKNGPMEVYKKPDLRKHKKVRKESKQIEGLAGFVSWAVISTSGKAVYNSIGIARGF